MTFRGQRSRSNPKKFEVKYLKSLISNIYFSRIKFIHLDWNIIFESLFGRKTANIIIKKNKIVYQEL